MDSSAEIQEPRNETDPCLKTPELRDETKSDRCDESKCVSWLFDYDWETDHLMLYHCYGNDATSHPMLCADGFVPKVVEEEAPKYLEGSKQYYTCCPPDYPSAAPAPSDTYTVERHCSDPIQAHLLDYNDDDNDDDNDGDNYGGVGNIDTSTICDTEETRKHLRQTMFGDLLCCDSNSTFDNTTFLEDIECVQYYESEWYSPATIDFANSSMPFPCDDPGFPVPRRLDYDPDFSTARYQCCKSGPALTFADLNSIECLPEEEDPIVNGIGDAPPFQCNNPDFSIPRLVNSDDLSSGVYPYRCCRSGPDMLYVTDSAFKITVFTDLTMYSITAVYSLIVVVGLLVPFMIDLKQGRFERTNQRNGRNIGRRNSAPRFSTWNLYLIYLLFPDLLFAMYRVVIDALKNMQKDVPNDSFVDDFTFPFILLLSCSCANLYINAFVSYQVLLLLKASREARRIRQPSVTRVTLQVVAVYIFAAIFGFGTWWLWNNYINYYIAWGLVLGLPIVHVLGVSIFIWHRGYLSSLRRNSATPNERAMRALVVYFFRIVYVFILVWIPGLSLFIYFETNTSAYWAMFLYQLTPGVQAIISTSMILTKPDVREYVTSLLKLYNLFGNRAQEINREKTNHKTAMRNTEKLTNTTSVGNALPDTSVIKREHSEIVEDRTSAFVANVMVDSDSACDRDSNNNGSNNDGQKADNLGHVEDPADEDMYANRDEFAP